MGKFTFHPCRSSAGTLIPQLMLVEPTVFGDERGSFTELFSPELSPLFRHLDGSAAQLVQVNESRSRRGVLRGLHFQSRDGHTHALQGKLVRCVEGMLFDAVVDLRAHSPSYGECFGVTLTEEDPRMLWVPEGFAHGYLALSERVRFQYFVTNPYCPEEDSGIRWDSAGIVWPDCGAPLCLSPKDEALPPLQERRVAF